MGLRFSVRKKSTYTYLEISNDNEEGYIFEPSIYDGDVLSLTAVIEFFQNHTYLKPSDFEFVQLHYNDGH